MSPRNLRYAAALGLALTAAPLAAQGYTDLDRQRAQLMLDNLGKDLVKYYYDSTFGGQPIRTLIDSTRAQIGRSQSNEQSFALIGRIFLALGNRWTWFHPPALAARIDYGWTAECIGDTVYLSAVDTASDAYHQGARVGDRLLGVDGFAVDRQDLMMLNYVLNGLQPRSAVTLTLATDAAAPRQVHAAATVIPGKQLLDISGFRGDDRIGSGDIGSVLMDQERDVAAHQVHLVSVTPDILVWRMRSMNVPVRDVRTALNRAGQGKALILDLRDNDGGGWLEMMDLLDALAGPSDSGRVVGRFLPRHLAESGLVSDLTGKDWKDSLYLKPDPKHAFNGRFIVLVNDGTVGHGEILAATVERLHLGTVLGDRTGGAVTFARLFRYRTPGYTSEYYGALIGVAAFQLPDGSRIEGVGVTPDETILPTPRDLRAGDDPVLARALAMVGDTITAAQAAAIDREKGDAFTSIPPRTTFVSPRH